MQCCKNKHLFELLSKNGRFLDVLAASKAPLNLQNAILILLKSLHLLLNL